MKPIHPILSELQRRRKTQRWLVAKLAEAGAPISPPHLCDIISGRRRPSPAVAEALAAALGNKVKAAAIVFWKPAPASDATSEPDAAA